MGVTIFGVINSLRTVSTCDSVFGCILPTPEIRRVSSGRGHLSFWSRYISILDSIGYTYLAFLSAGHEPEEISIDQAFGYAINVCCLYSRVWYIFSIGNPDIQLGVQLITQSEDIQLGVQVSPTFILSQPGWVHKFKRETSHPQFLYSQENKKRNIHVYTHLWNDGWSRHWWTREQYFHL